MDLAQLRIFKAVVEEGGVTAAARRLHRVQSNVTSRIRQLERSLDVQLFVRQGRRLNLTSAGTLLYRYAGDLLALADQARNVVTQAPGEERLRLGAMESVAASRLPTVLAAFRQLEPAISMDISTAPSRELVTDVAEGRLDAALVGEVVDPARFASLALWTEELLLVADRSQQELRNARAVRGRALLVFKNGCAYRARLERWLTSAGIVPERMIELPSYHAILASAAAGIGVGVVPRSVLQGMAGAEAVSVHELPARIGRVTIQFIGLHSRPSPARERLAVLLKQNAGTA